MSKKKSSELLREFGEALEAELLEEMGRRAERGEYEGMEIFQPGDYVRYTPRIDTHCLSCPPYRAIGIVRSHERADSPLWAGLYLVEFLVDFHGGHSGGEHHLRTNRGYFLDRSDLKRVRAA